MAPYGSAIKPWPSGQIMATPMITRRGGYHVRYAKLVASARLAARAQQPAMPGLEVPAKLLAPADEVSRSDRAAPAQ
jgi:hypothetical protein